MPKTKFQSVIFTLIAAWLMVYAMTVYNLALAAGELRNALFLTALKSMWVEYVLIALCAHFLSSRLAVRCAFRVVRPSDRPIAIILAVQTFMVVFQVAFASILGLWHSYGFTNQLIGNYLTVYCRNFLMALPLQLLAAGPFARWLLRRIFPALRAETDPEEAKKEPCANSI